MNSADYLTPVKPEEEIELGNLYESFTLSAFEQGGNVELRDLEERENGFFRIYTRKSLKRNFDFIAYGFKRGAPESFSDLWRLDAIDIDTPGCSEFIASEKTAERMISRIKKNSFENLFSGFLIIQVPKCVKNLNSDFIHISE